MVWMPGQSVCLIELAWLWNDDIVISSQQNRPACLTMCECLLRREVLEVGMVRKKICLVNIALEVMVKMGQSMDNSQEFLIMDLVVAFCRLQGF